MRWPFGPSHLTLKPSKRKHQKTKKYKDKKNKKRKNKKKQKNTKIPKKKLFSYQSNFSFAFGGCPNFPFFDNLAEKTRTQKTL